MCIRDRDIGTLWLDHSCGSGRFRVKPEVRSQLLRCFITAQIEQSCHKVDYIPLGSAAEAEEIILVQLQARMPVVVERPASHTIAAVSYTHLDVYKRQNYKGLKAAAA